MNKQSFLTPLIADKSHKIAVGLSGGVDSSVAALLLKRAGYDLFALFMQNWHDTRGTLHGDCEWEEDRFVAEMVAKKLEIPFHFVDLSDIYRERVVDYMFSEYEKGRTPNPDVLCNREVKFDAFLKTALNLGADFVATGHYCRKDEFRDDSGNTIYRILAGRDPGKDQSYFLCQLNQKQLSRTLFPIGDLLKREVRELAREAQLPSAEKKDSQGICFVGKVDLPLFLQQKLEPKEGDVVEIFREHYNSLPELKSLEEISRPLCYIPSQGKVIGCHQGAHYYTVGQRKGLNIGGHKEPLFIISIDINTNTIYVGEGQSHPGLYRRALKILPAEVHWIRPDLTLKSGDELECNIRIRYRQPLQKGRLISRQDALYILFDEPQRGITPGQFAVWYAPDGEMLGSGVIDS
ncbi:MAG TPA: tRNA 2-thiouridine(34) synthase MnmA [Bacteroidales bacterium]|nr:tRNA 2-thiouridine(34) synthase MnmA [Bacteroidales bacterium]HPB88719.1 tRNA 2-thiouridine(34) synthase MnmA [Bacteroidales bacterium]HPY21300.1 tRNA 2-thiouridine(34) synthase MnmA [Bacteroidales bacterium]HQA92689.1 tRNA 2-thiouridine(34) synthase MnmA [Bacteroidales bacterium]HQN24269.1 tRNA 2-thiouridine(34) synthase MnmA [Bacteroidales bacterium]